MFSILLKTKKVYFYRTTRIKLLTEQAVYNFLLKETFKVRASYDFFSKILIIQLNQKLFSEETMEFRR